MANISLGKVKFVYKGDYNESTKYTKGDIVSYSGRHFIYKNEIAKTYSPIIIPTIVGTAATVGINTNIVQVSFTGFDPSQRLNQFIIDSTPKYDSDYGWIQPRTGHRVYSKYFDENTGIATVGNATANSITIRLNSVGFNTTVQSNIPVVIGPRRLATGYDVTLNENDWDVYSDGYVFKGDWNTSIVYIPGDIVKRRNSSYLCGIGNSGCDPIFDFEGCWEQFSRGDDLMPSDRILTFVNNQPFGWRGHPFISGPTWSGNTWQGNIPWSSTLGIGSTSPHAWRWNPGWIKNHLPYRAAFGFVNGEGIFISDGGTPSVIYSQSNVTHIDPQENDIPYNTDFLLNNQPHQGNLPAEKVTFYPRIIQALHGANSLRAYLLSNGTVSCAGEASASLGYWGMGNNDTTTTNACYSIPKSAFRNRAIVKLAISNSASYDSDGHIIALDEHGEIHLWGRNDTGQCGVSSEPHNTNVFVSVNGTLDDSRQWTVHCMNKDEFFAGNRVVDIWAGHRTSYALTEDGTLYSWGYNTYGQLGYRTDNASGIGTGFRTADRNRSPKAIPITWSSFGGIQKVVVASCENTDFLVVLDGQGQLWTQGYNAYGQLGDGTSTNGTNASALTRRTTWTGLSGSIVNVWADLDNATTAHIWFRTSDGRTYGIGYNGHYNLTNGTTTNATTPVKIHGPYGDLTNIVTISSAGRSGGVTQLFLDDRGYVYGTGWNNYGEAGSGQAGNVANNLVRYQTLGRIGIATTSTAGIGSTQSPNAVAFCMHSPFHMSDSNPTLSFDGLNCVDVFVNGYYDATSGHTPRSFTMFDDGSLLARGRNYDYGYASYRGDIRGSVPLHNIGA